METDSVRPDVPERSAPPPGQLIERARSGTPLHVAEAVTPSPPVTEYWADTLSGKSRLPGSSAGDDAAAPVVGTPREPSVGVDAPAVVAGVAESCVVGGADVVAVMVGGAEAGGVESAPPPWKLPPAPKRGVGTVVASGPESGPVMADGVPGEDEAGLSGAAASAWVGTPVSV
jgi:hypothetical protein